jgi:FKBP-type peptidyl-prolyl cis-trans isomerase SlyD
MNLYRFWGKIALACLLTCVLTAPVLAAEGKNDPAVMRVSAGELVSLKYTLKLDNRSVVESNVGGEPMWCRHGSHELIPGLEKELEGEDGGRSQTGHLQA